MRKFNVMKIETVEYSVEYDEEEISRLLGLRTDQMSDTDLAHHIQKIDGDLHALHAAVEGSRDCVASTWIVTTVL